MSGTNSSPGNIPAAVPARRVRLFRAPLVGFWRTAVFFLKVFPMIPSRAVDRITPRPVIEKVCYPTSRGKAEGDLYRPEGQGPFPGIVVCLGVVPFGVDHPQVPVLGRALARAGFAALLYWSPAMRDFRMDAEDVENISLAYDWLVRQPSVDASRSGLLGTCVGGSFALMAAATGRVRGRVAFASAYAPFSSMITFAREIASASVDNGEGRRPWKVDQLTRRVFVHSLTAHLPPDEGEQMRGLFETARGNLDAGELSPLGKAMYPLFADVDAAEAEAALRGLPRDLRQQLEVMSPLNYIQDLDAPLVVLLHDRGDQVIPVGETRRLAAALAGRTGVHFTEMNFSHLDPTKGRLPLLALLREFGKFFGAVYPIFRQSAG